MDVVCNDCKSKFRIPDEKIPSGKAVSFACPKCKSRINVDLNKKGDDAGKVTVGDETIDVLEDVLYGTDSGSLGDEKDLLDVVYQYDASEKPFDFVETERKTALICETNSALNQPITNALRTMAYHISNAPNARDALKMIWYHLFDLIVINEDFDTDNPEINPVLKHMEDLNMSVRRNIYVVMTSKRFRTMDQMMAFNKSVNLIINAGKIDQTEQILSRGLSDQETLYQIYKDYIAKTLSV